MMARRQRQLWSPLRDWTEEVKELGDLWSLGAAVVVVVVVGTLVVVVEGKHCCSCANGCIDLQVWYEWRLYTILRCSEDYCSGIRSTVDTSTE